MLIGLIYFKLFIENDFYSLWMDFQSSNSLGSFFLAAAAICLMPFNWFIEGHKWRKALGDEVNITITDSIKAVLAGLSVGILTPARLGEYGGRILLIKSKHNHQGVLATMYTSLTQNLVTFLFGLLAFIILSAMHINVISDWSYIFAIGLVFSIAVILLLIYAGTVYKYLLNLKLVKNFIDSSSYIEKLKDLEPSLVLNISIWSALRYFVYSSQYILLLHYFGAQNLLPELYLGTSILFLIQSGIPLPPLLNLLARGQLAIMIWEVFQINELTILMATFSLWIINLILPALIGYMVIYNTRIFKSIGIEEN